MRTYKEDDPSTWGRQGSSVLNYKFWNKYDQRWQYMMHRYVGAKRVGICVAVMPGSDRWTRARMLKAKRRQLRYLLEQERNK